MAEKKAEAKASDKKALAKKNAKNKKPNVFKRLWKYLLSCKSEIKKITWTSPRTTTKNFGIVIAVIVVMGLVIFGVDSGLFALLGLFMGTGTAA